jgi:hypothetical protein
MSNLLTRKRWILAKLEASSYGVDSSPVGTNAIRCTNLEITPLAGDTIPRDTIRSYFGGSPTLVANSQVQCSITVEMAGSGTAGNAPAFAPLLLACANAQTLTAAPVTGTPTAGSANSLTLAAGASAVNNFYNGMVLTITAGLGNGTSFVVTAYNGTTKVATLRQFAGSTAVTLDATSAYSIAANAAYTPITDTFGVADTSITVYYFIDRILHKFTGGRGTFTFSMPLGQIPTITFNFTGIYVTPSDATTPAAVYPTDVVPQIFRSTNSGGFGFLGHYGCVESIEFDLGNQVEYRELVGCTRQVIITDRASTGTVMVEAPLMAVKDYFSAALDDAQGGSGALHWLHGTTAGNRVSFIAPNVDLGQPTYGESQGISMLNLPYNAIPTVSGNDEYRLVFS